MSAEIPAPTATRHFPMPPVRHTATGAERRIGVELELGGLDAEALAALVATHVGGRIERLSRYEQLVHGDAAGPWTVELDFAWMKARARELGEPEADSVEGTLENLLRRGTEQLMPMEVVSPPLPLRALADCQRLVERLRAAGARGTGDSIAYAFAMQLNPELPDLRVETIVAYLRAFLCLSDWLFERAEVDLTRRVTTFADPFPMDYVRQVIDPAYNPELPTFIDDYLRANPTRNRALDLLPLLAHLDEPRVRAAAPDPRIKARPTFHYRLPNCDIGHPDWGIHLAWRDWLQVEHLATDRERLARLCGAYLDFLAHPLDNLLVRWPQRVQPWLIPPEDL